MAQSIFPFAFPAKKERDHIRQAIVDICLKAGFLSTNQKTYLSPPQLLRFIVANASGFIAWVQATRADADEARRVLAELAAQDAAGETRSTNE